VSRGARTGSAPAKIRVIPRLTWHGWTIEAAIAGLADIRFASPVADLRASSVSLFHKALTFVLVLFS
jgi:hypothetical protein